MKITEKIKKFVEAESKKPSGKYGHEPFEFHIKVTVNIAKKLARKYKADIEVVEIAGWLHDIGSFRHGRKNHHITGVKIAENKLRQLKYPEE